MQPPPGHTPEVHERKYSSSDWGPDEDTSTFYKGTPAPGDRADQVVPARRKEASDAGRLPRKARKTSGAETVERLKAPATALAGLAALCLLTGGLVFAAVSVYQSFTTPTQPPVTVNKPVVENPGQPAPTEDSPTPTDGKDDTWKGLKVKKGLR